MVQVPAYLEKPTKFIVEVPMKVKSIIKSCRFLLQTFSQKTLPRKNEEGTINYSQTVEILDLLFKSTLRWQISQLEKYRNYVWTIRK